MEGTVCLRIWAHSDDPPPEGEGWDVWCKTPEEVLPYLIADVAHTILLPDEGEEG